jgi:hypothetical protein
VIPNLQHDMHDGTIAQGDTWLHDNLDGYIQWAKNNNSLFVLTFDEDSNNGFGNRIVTLFVGAMVQHGNYNSHYNHSNLLRTFEEIYGLGYAGLSSDSSAITGCWDYTIPVELLSFDAISNNDGKVILSWSTSTETNNSLFLIERKMGEAQFSTIASIRGNGTSSIPHSYSFTNNTFKSGLYFYRLKQVDFNGSYNYSKIININVTNPGSYFLGQNFPNPFNPITTIKFSIPEEAPVNLSVYNILGERVKELKNEIMKPGYFEVQFDASNLASGVYFYRIKAGDPSTSSGQVFIQTKKMILLK